MARQIYQPCLHTLPNSTAFPETVHVGVRVAKLGNSSVRYELAIFKNNQTTASAHGYFVHVYVDKQTQRPVPIPEHARTALGCLLRSRRFNELGNAT